MDYYTIDTYCQDFLCHFSQIPMTKPEYSELGKKIREIRGGRTQAEFAKLIESEQSKISRYETGAFMPPAPILKNIARVGGTTVEKLLGLVLDSKQGYTLERVDVDPYISNLDDGFVHLTVYQLTGAGNEMENVEYQPVGPIALA